MTLTAPQPANLTTLAPAVQRYVDASLSPNTRRAYRSAWRAFGQWLGSQPALPVPSETVAAYLSHLADSGKTYSTVDTHLSAICQAHRFAGFDSPRDAAVVAQTLRGIRSTLGTRPRKVDALSPAQLRAALKVAGTGPLGLRNRAMLLLGWTAALRRAELVALNVPDLRFDDRGLVVTVRRSKTDQGGAGVEVAVPYSGTPSHCPVRACRAWLDALGRSTGPVFVDTRSGRRLASEAVADTLTDLLNRAGIPGRFAGHSLRAGFATTAARSGKPLRAIMSQTRHTSVGMLMEYVRPATLFEDNAASGLLDGGGV